MSKNKFADINLPVIEIGDKKLILSPLTIQILNAKPGDKLCINYIQHNNHETFPVIGKAEVFVDPENGQKLTKSDTMSFRGNQMDMLSQFGDLFRLELYKNNMYKLTSINEIDLLENNEDFKEELNNFKSI